MSLRRLLGEGRVYHRLKASPLYDMYWRFADRKILEARDGEVAFYRTLLDGLKAGDLIYDIGANHGYKADIFLRLGARVVAVDPDPANFLILRSRFLEYRLKPRPVTIVNKAVSSQPGVMTLWIDSPGSAKNTLSPKWVDTLRDDTGRFGEKLSFASQRDVETTTITALIGTLGHPFFVKIDVEGHELDVIKGMRESVPYLSFEVNLPEFLSEGLKCVDLLHELNAESTFNYSAGIDRGLELERWVPHRAFRESMQSCRGRSIEVFCRTPRGDA